MSVVVSKRCCCVSVLPDLWCLPFFLLPPKWQSLSLRGAAAVSLWTEQSTDTLTRYESLSSPPPTAQRHSNKAHINWVANCRFLPMPKVRAQFWFWCSMSLGLQASSLGMGVGAVVRSVEGGWNTEQNAVLPPALSVAPGNNSTKIKDPERSDRSYKIFEECGFLIIFSKHDRSLRTQYSNVSHFMFLSYRFLC